MQNDEISLRCLTEKDFDFLKEIENDPENWLVSETIGDFSNETLLSFIHSTHDLHINGQIRWVIVSNIDEKPLGFLDLFDYDPLHLRAGVGILVAERYRGFGWASKSLQLFLKHAADYKIKNLHAQVLEDNTKSHKLFTSVGFKHVGGWKSWFNSKGLWRDMELYQYQID